MRLAILAVAAFLVAAFWYLVAVAGQAGPVIGLLAVLIGVCAVCLYMIGRRVDRASPFDFDDVAWIDPAGPGGAETIIHRTSHAAGKPGLIYTSTDRDPDMPTDETFDTYRGYEQLRLLRKPELE